MASKKTIQNFPINTSDITNDQNIFDQNLTGTRGKTVWQTPDRLVMDYNAVPKDFIKTHKFVTIVEDVMFVNGAPFLINM